VLVLRTLIKERITGVSAAGHSSSTGFLFTIPRLNIFQTKRKRKMLRESWRKCPVED